MAITPVPFTPVYGESIVLADIPDRTEKLLDYGCGDGSFTRKLLPKVRHLYACDVDKLLVAKNKKEQSDILYQYVVPRKKLPYPDNYFQIVTLMGVLEHVYDERETLEEIYRVVKPGGYVYVYGIQKGLFGFMDFANLKFAFPGIHKLLYELFFGKSAYKKEFVKKEKMFGDFTEGKSWHSHYSKKDIQELSKGLFTIKKWWAYSLFLPLLLVLEFVYAKITRKLSPLLAKVIGWDNSLDLGSLSYCFVVKLKKT